MVMQQNLTQPSALASPSTRRFDLDWVRIGAFGLLILYHVGMLYVPWSFHIKSAHPVAGLEPLMLLLNPWRLALLFLVSGVATRFMVDKLAAGQLMRARSARLLIPLLFGMLVVVPPQAYVQILESVGYPAGFLDFYLRHYFAFGAQFCAPGPCILLPTWNHLWFVAYLWVYTMALGFVLLAFPGLLRRAGKALEPMFSGWLLLVMPPVILAAYRLVLLPHFPSTHALGGDWYNHALYATVFAFGLVVARADAVWSAMVRCRWLALGLAAALFVAAIVPYAVTRSQGGAVSPTIRMAYGAAYGGYQWFCVVAILGFARIHLNRDGPVRRYLTDAVFPYYIVHQTAIILIAHALRNYDLPASIEALLVIGGTLAACAGAYEIARRIRLLRPLMGLRLDLAGARVQPMRSAQR